MAKPKEQLDPVAGATGVAGGLHLFIPENEAALAVADSGHVPLHRVVDQALTTLHRDQFRASALVSKLTDASRIHYRRDIGALTILFRNPEDAEWVMQALTELRSGDDRWRE